MAILCGIAFLQMYFSQGKNVSFTSKFNDGAAARMNAKNESSVLIGGLPAPASSSISRISSPSNGKIDYVHGGERELEPLPSFEFSAPAVSRLTYRLVPHRPYNMTGHQQDNLNKYQCNISKPPRSKAIKTRSELPNDNPFQEFSTYIQTNLNILFMGDSLSVEFGSWFQIASQAPKTVALYGLRKSSHQNLQHHHMVPHQCQNAACFIQQSHPCRHQRHPCCTH